MSAPEAEKTAATPTATKPKKKAASKPKEPASHPKYSEMIKAAVASLKERGGSSRQAILKYIMSHYDVGKDEKVVNQHLKMSLRASVKRGSLKQSKGTGASGSFRLGEAAKKAKRAKKPQAAAAKKAKKPKAIGEKKALKQSKGAKKAKAADKGKKAAGKAKKAAGKAKKPAKEKPKSQEESK